MRTWLRVVLISVLLGTVGLLAALGGSASPRSTAEGVLLLGSSAHRTSDGTDAGPEDMWLFEQLGGPMAHAPTAAELAAIGREARAVRVETSRSAPALAALRWRYRGPSFIGGRVTDLGADVKRRNTLYAASASGGVWKSTDGGVNFSSIWPISYPQAIGALTVGPDDHIWVGTGEANPGGGSVTYGGDGVYLSTDHGKHWRHVGLAGTVSIGRIAVDPSNPRHVLVAATGNLYRPGGRRGLYETWNAGKTWKRAFAPPNSTTGAVDVAIDPKNPKDILVSMWDRIRYPDVRYYTGPGSGIWQSTDGGHTFSRLGAASGLPPNPSQSGRNSPIGRIGVTFDPEDPSKAYAIVANNQVGSYGVFFGSVDGGAHWAALPGGATLEASQSVYGWWFGRLYVDPHDSNHLFVTGLMLYQSQDGGLSFSPDTVMHSDHHTIAFDPFHRNRVWDGDDGGVYTSKDDGSTWTHAKHEPWMQFFTVAVSPQVPWRISGGMQDNGSARSWNAHGKPGWNTYYGGDGVENTINPFDKRNVFACSQYGSCGRSDNGGNTMSDMNNTFDRAGWFTPIVFQPGSSRVMYWAGDVVDRSTDRGRNWKQISPDLGKGNGGREINPLYANHYGTVQAIGLNRKDPKTIYAGTDEGYLWKTTNLGGSWTQLTSKALPNRWVTQIVVNPGNPNQLYVSFSGYHQGVHAAYVLTSSDGGRRWKDLSANLPHAPVNDLVLSGHTLFAATNVGVYESSVRRPHWYSVGRALPSSPITWLRYLAPVHTLYAATFGHGIWSIRLPSMGVRPGHHHHVSQRGRHRHRVSRRPRHHRHRGFTG